MNRIIGIALLVLGLFGLVGVPHDIGLFWAGIAGVAMGSMLVAFSFSRPNPDYDLKIEPKFGEMPIEPENPRRQNGEPSLRASPLAATPLAAPPRPPAPHVPTVRSPPPIFPASPGPRPARHPATYGWFGADRNIRMAASLNELMAAIRSWALMPQTSVHRVDDSGNTGPVIAANADPLLRVLFWAAENDVPDKALPGLIKSVTQIERQGAESTTSAVVG